MRHESEKNEAYRRYKDTSFFGSLNGIRFICIIAVMWHHSPMASAYGQDILLLRRGFIGVDFFFVLSGFLITTLLLREEERDGRFSLVAFYRRRFLRIIPPYFLLVTAVSAYFVLWRGQEELAPLVPYYYFFLSNFLIEDIPLLTITWSLAVEEQYYLMWPLLLLLIASQRRRLAVLLLLIAICVASAGDHLAFLGLEPIRTEHAVWSLPASGYAAILIGSLLGIALNDPDVFRQIHRLAGWRYAPPAAFVALLIALQETPPVLLGWPNLLIHSLMACCIASVVVRENNILAPLLSWPPVARVGMISYGIYLYHLVGRHVADIATSRMALPAELYAPIMTLLLVVFSIAIAELSFRYFEQYFLKLKTRRNVGRPEMR